MASSFPLCPSAHSAIAALPSSFPPHIRFSSPPVPLSAKSTVETEGGETFHLQSEHGEQTATILQELPDESQVWGPNYPDEDCHDEHYHDEDYHFEEEEESCTPRTAKHRRKIKFSCEAGPTRDISLLSESASWDTASWTDSHFYIPTLKKSKSFSNYPTVAQGSCPHRNDSKVTGSDRCEDYRGRDQGVYVPGWTIAGHCKCPLDRVRSKRYIPPYIPCPLRSSDEETQWYDHNRRHRKGGELKARTQSWKRDVQDEVEGNNFLGPNYPSDQETGKGTRDFKVSSLRNRFSVKPSDRSDLFRGSRRPAEYFKRKLDEDFKSVHPLDWYRWARLAPHREREAIEARAYDALMSSFYSQASEGRFSFTSSNRWRHEGTGGNLG